MGPSKEVKNNPDYKYFERILSSDSEMAIKEDEAAEKEPEKHPWRVPKGTNAFAGPWSEEKSPAFLGVFPETVYFHEINREQDGPYTSINGYIQNLTPEQKRAFVKAGLDKAIWIIRQQLRGKRSNPWMRTSDIEENT